MSISVSGKYSVCSIVCDPQLLASTHFQHHTWRSSLCKPITRLYNLSIATSTVPHQWKTASIKLIPTPKQSKATSRLQTNFNYPSINQSYGAISCNPVSLPMLSSSTTKFVIYRPICLSAHRLTNSSHNPSPPYNLPPPHRQSVCCCNLS